MSHLAAALAMLLAAAPALAVEVSGVKVPDTASVGGKTLALNGAGVRRKFIVKVYVGALYLEQRSRDAAAILAADAPWKVTMTLLRDVSHEKIVGAFKEGFENNSPGQLAQLSADLSKLEVILQDLKEGQVLELTYAPAEGTTLTAPGGATATVAGHPFGAALLRNWLGAKPADGGLKDAMLGR